jgi:hypothetical protein
MLKTTYCFTSAKHRDAWQQLIGGRLSSLVASKQLLASRHQSPPIQGNELQHYPGTEIAACVSAAAHKGSICLRKQTKKHTESPGVMAAKLARLRNVWSSVLGTSDHRIIISSVACVHLAGAGMMSAIGRSC